jgi:alpha-beta hydrolase superfamily lysophospholipase
LTIIPVAIHGSNAVKIANRDCFLRRTGLLAGVLSLALIAGLPGPADQSAHASNAHRPDIEKVSREMPALDLAAAPGPTPSIGDYFRFYGLDFEDVIHHFGRFRSGKHRIAGHVWVPADPAGTFFLMHGYFDHSGTLNHLIRACLEKGFAVAVFDLPGHGLSSGKMGCIDDFAEYVAVLNDFITLCGRRLPPPFHLAAHSTGCAIAYEYLNHAPRIVFDKIVWLAPLVRNAHWHLSTVGYHLARPFVETLPGANRRNSSDENFVEFARHDPLRNNRLCLRFLDALHAWNRKIAHYPVLAKPVLVIQGTADGIVDWKYNLDFLKSKISHLEVELIEKANHQLANESRELRQRVFERIFDYVESSDTTGRP